MSLLTGFLKRRKRPETGKISQKSAPRRHTDPAFTMLSLTIVRRYEMHAVAAKTFGGWHYAK